MLRRDASDARLVQRARRGDADAYDALVRRYLERAFALAYRLLQQREDAEDVTQEAFVGALEHLDEYDTRRPFAPWFFRIVANRALNARAHRERRRTEDLPPETAAAGMAPDRSAELDELGSRLQAAMAQLPERQRTIVQLSGFEELNSTEIGQLLDLPAGTVRWELHQARLGLRAALASYAVERSAT